MRIFYFYLVCFPFSISYSVLPFHLFYVFQFLHLFFFMFLNVIEKLLYTYIVNIYILENLWIFA